MPDKIEILENVIEMIPIYDRMREWGFLSFFCAHNEDMGVQMTKNAFLLFFPIHKTKPYNSADGKYGKEAFAFHNGQRFFTLLEEEDFGHEDIPASEG